MIFVQNDSNDAAYHFSAEEYFARYAKLKEAVYMLWQTGKTVMLGSNQMLSAEIDVDYAKKSDILIVRRSSGGGAIYTDPGTVLYTVIEPISGDISLHRENIASEIIKALGKMGVPAERKGRNDILVDNKKVSGFAQYTSGNHVCTHGSLLYDADLETLTNVLIPNEEKLRPKGISSVRSRVTNIKLFTKAGFSTGEFIAALKSNLIINTEHKEYIFADNEIQKITQIYNEKYKNDDWNYRM
ncbi:MAG: lipoate--protein ligase family protein [Oscillospiraceae bacterium]|nr:lipoate--protein ligase family protein [Oscillospiraceae bacterium]